MPVLRVGGATPPHTKGKPQSAQLVEPGGVGGVARFHIGREIVGKPKLMLASARERYRVAGRVKAKQRDLLGSGAEAGKKAGSETEQQRRKEQVPA
ncbi:MAG: hypothetical protein V3S54_09240 [Woeseiaceae bacterium]